MTFEDLLAPQPRPCRVCKFLDGLNPPLADEVRTAIAKPTYSEETLARGMGQVDSEENQAPGVAALRTHRTAGHK